MRSSRTLGHLLLGELQLVAPLADMCGDPVFLAQLSERGVLGARFPVCLVATGAVRRRIGGRSPFRADTTVLSGTHAKQFIDFDKRIKAFFGCGMARLDRPSGAVPAAGRPCGA